MDRPHDDKMWEYLEGWGYENDAMQECVNAVCFPRLQISVSEELSSFGSGLALLSSVVSNFVIVVVSGVSFVEILFRFRKCQAVGKEVRVWAREERSGTGRS